MGAIPLVIVAYGVFLLFDYSRANPPTDIQNIENIQKIGSINGLLFGGSNAVYGLSAEFLTYHTGLKWYNASVTGELQTISRHKNFIRDLSARIDRTKVRYVVYSSMVPYVPGTIAKLKSRENFGIKPKVSVLDYIRQPTRNWEFLQRNRFGDLVYEKVNCHFRAYVSKYQHEDEDISVEFLVDYANFFASLFPNASILIVLPSLYYAALSFNDSMFEQTLRTKFYSVLNAQHFKNTVKITFQPPFSSPTQVCNEVFHANEDGRLWRTRNLIESMR
jgi:hypothetical protein